jgi:hypothetical protein
MTDAAHNQDSETRRPSDRDHIVTTGPAVSSPPVQKCFADIMSVSVGGIPKNRCRTTVPARMVETRADLPFIRDQVVCLSHDRDRTHLQCQCQYDCGGSMTRMRQKHEFGVAEI